MGAAGGAGLPQDNMVVKARLVLHFDINKTILMSDKAQAANTDFMVNVLLSECAWGRLEPGPTWVPVGRLATDRCAPSAHLLRMTPAPEAQTEAGTKTACYVSSL